MYELSGEYVNYSPVYKSSDELYGIWYDGQTGSAGDWMIGSLSNIAEEKYTYGFVSSNQDTSCPTVTDTWNEFYNGEWEDNIQAVVECHGM